MMRLAVRADRPIFLPAPFCCRLAKAGPTSRSMERTLAAAQPWRSVTLARATPWAECSPVASPTRISARAVSSSNCDCRADRS